jgi:hypothetical protein
LAAQHLKVLFRTSVAQQLKGFFHISVPQQLKVLFHHQHLHTLLPEQQTALQVTIVHVDKVRFCIRGWHPP